MPTTTPETRDCQAIPTDGRLWTVEHTALFLGKTTGSLYKWIGLGQGPLSVRMGNRRMFDPADVRAWVAEAKALTAKVDGRSAEECRALAVHAQALAARPAPAKTRRVKARPAKQRFRVIAGGRG